MTVDPPFDKASPTGDAQAPSGDAGAPATGSIDPWRALRTATRARIGLGRAGNAIPMQAVLEFQLAHARARDAVHQPLDAALLEQALAPHAVLHVVSAADDRSTYLRRPDLGRALAKGNCAVLDDAAHGAPDLVFVIADGLSAAAVQTHAAPLLHACIARLSGWRIAPIVIVNQGRVAVADDVGMRLNARMSAILIGERPGLSVPDSLGVYLTYGPRPGRRDAERNCVSNIHRDGGLSYDQAADKIAWLLNQASRRELTGIDLKDDAASSITTSADDPVARYLPVSGQSLIGHSKGAKENDT